MNARLLCTVYSVVMSIFLFASGFLILVYIGSSPTKNASNIKAENNNDINKNSIFNTLLTPLKSSLEPLKIDKKSVNILIMGGDFVNKNTDTIFVVHLNPFDNSLKFLSIPRDTKITTETATSHKINSAYPRGGGKSAVSTVKKLLNIDIDYYVYIDFKTFRYIIDTLGGVKYSIPEDMDYDDPTQDLHIHIKKGYQLLNGQQSEGYMRFRQYNSHKVSKYYDGSDINRIKSQQNFILEFIRQKANIYSIAKFNDILNIVLKHVETDFNLNDVLKIINYSSNITVEKVKMFTLPGVFEESLSWYYIMDRDKAKSIIELEFLRSEY